MFSASDNIQSASHKTLKKKIALKRNNNNEVEVKEIILSQKGFCVH
jgi:hypothetical protein